MNHLSKSLLMAAAYATTVVAASPAIGQDGRGWYINAGPIGQYCHPSIAYAQSGNDCPKFYDIDQVDAKFANASLSWIGPLRATTADHSRRLQTLEQKLGAALQEIRMQNAQIVALQSELQTALTQLRQTQSTVSGHRNDFNEHKHDGNGAVVIP